MRISAVAVTFVLVHAVCTHAWADVTAEAEQLYQQGTELLKDKKLDAACSAFDKSEKLEPRGGTLLSLAYCHEQQGRMALAHTEYDEALRRLRLGGGRRDREEFAAQRMEAIKDKVVFVTVELAPAVNAPSLDLLISPSKAGDAERKIVLGQERQKAIALDPDGGSYRIQVSATGRKPFTAQVQVTGKTVSPATVTVTDLAADGAGGGGTGARGPEPDGSGQRTLGLVLGGAGLVLVGGGAFFGVSALNCARDVRDNQGCDESTAKNVYANLANVGIGLGVVGLVAGGYLYLSAPKGSGTEQAQASRTVRFAPSVGPSSAGLSIDGRF